MTNSVKHVPKHRGTPRHAHIAERPKKAFRTTMVVSTVAVAATGGTIAGGLVGSGAGATASHDAADAGGSGTPVEQQIATPDAFALADAAVATRSAELSRSSDRRAETDPVKEIALAAPAGPADSGSEDLSDADPRDIAKALLGEFGFGLDQFGCLDSLYMRESGWRWNADNPYSSAYGIPQALPGSKMASAGADWATNPVTQIRWGLGYIQDRYGSPCGAWAHSESHGWY